VGRVQQRSPRTFRGCSTHLVMKGCPERLCSLHPWSFLSTDCIKMCKVSNLVLSHLWPCFQQEVWWDDSLWGPLQPELPWEDLSSPACCFQQCPTLNLGKPAKNRPSLPAPGKHHRRHFPSKDYSTLLNRPALHEFLILWPPNSSRAPTQTPNRCSAAHRQPDEDHPATPRLLCCICSPFNAHSLCSLSTGNQVCAGFKARCPFPTTQLDPAPHHSEEWRDQGWIALTFVFQVKAGSGDADIRIEMQIELVWSAVQQRRHCSSWENKRCTKILERILFSSSVSSETSYRRGWEQKVL